MLFARTGELHELRPNALQVVDLAVDLLNLLFCLGSDVRTGVRDGAQIEQFTNLLQREAQILCAFDEADVSDMLLTVFPIAGRRPRRLRQKPALLVIPNGVDIHTCTFCDVICREDLHKSLRFSFFCAFLLRLCFRRRLPFGCSEALNGLDRTLGFRCARIIHADYTMHQGLSTRPY